MEADTQAAPLFLAVQAGEKGDVAILRDGEPHITLNPIHLFYHHRARIEAFVPPLTSGGDDRSGVANPFPSAFFRSSSALFSKGELSSDSSNSNITAEELEEFESSYGQKGINRTLEAVFSVYCFLVSLHLLLKSAFF